jgi:hypothetical protein
MMARRGVIGPFAIQGFPDAPLLSLSEPNVKRCVGFLGWLTICTVREARDATKDTTRALGAVLFWTIPQLR